MAESTNNMNKLTIVVGAGDDYTCDVSNPSHHYLLIDARRDAVDALQTTYANSSQVNVSHVVVTVKSGRTQFYHYSLPEFSSALKPQELKQLLPGLTIKGSEYSSGTSLADIINDSSDVNELELILDVPGQELALLESLAEADSLLAIDALAVTTPNSGLYEQGNTATELSDWLQTQGFEQNNETSQAFSLTTQTWSVDKRAIRIAQLEKERDEALARTIDAEKQRDEAVARASCMSKELAEANEVRQKNADWAQNLKSQKETLEQKLEDSEKQLKQAQNSAQRFKNESDELQKKLETAEKYNEQLTKLNERMDYMFEQQRLQLEQATNALGRHITQTSSQQVTELKARLSLERTFGTNLINLNENDSNLSEVTAVTLTQQLEENSYDLIIEFGAGKSTEFLASAIINNHNPNKQLENKSGSNEYEASDFDLPRHVLSFEHDKKQFNEVKERIEQNSLQNLVDLKYAPLIPVSQSQELFYDCERALKNVASVLDGRDAKVLILINSSSSQKQPSCVAAVPTILNSLSAFRLDIVISDKAFSEKIMEDWQQLISERGLEFVKNQNSGICCLRVN